MRRVIVERHKTKTAVETARGMVSIEIETQTTIVVCAADEDELPEGCPFGFDEAPLVPALKRLPKRSR
ncbi:MAG: hypothetical protein ABSF67_12310 [Roseiarcus sp.]